MNVYDKLLNRSFGFINKVKTKYNKIFKQNNNDSNSNIIILMYHQIGTNVKNNIGPYKSNIISVKNFEEQLLFLKNNYKVLSLDDLIKEFNNIDLFNDKIAVLTFDDGFKDNYVNALPLLRKHKIPATIYITTNFVGNKYYPYEYKLADIIFKYDKLNFEFLGNNFYFDLSSTVNKVKCYNNLKKFAKWFNFYKREMFLEAISNSKNRSDEQSDLFMSWDKLKKLTQEPLVTIGAHTRTHPYLPSIKNKQIQLEEIKGSKNDLENKLNISIKHFSYPYGGYNYTLKKQVKESGFRSAVITSNENISNIKKDNLYRLPRIDANNINIEEVNNI